MFQLVPNRIFDSICLIAVYLFVIYNYYCITNNKKGTGYLVFVVFIVSFSLFYRPVGGDFWSYYEEYLLGVDYPYHHMEDIYYWLMARIPDNYLLWRICVWLPAAIIVLVIFRFLDVPSNIATVCFFALALIPAYYYTRNALALSVLYLGMAIIAQRVHLAKKTMSLFLFAVLAFGSWFLHRSMPIYIFIALVSLILPFHKKYILGALIVFPLLYGLVYLISSNFLEVAKFMLIDETGEFYLEHENMFTVSWKGVISLIIGYLPVFYFYIIAFTKPISYVNSDFSSYKVFLYFAFFTFFISFLFLGQGSDALQVRLYKSSMMPFSFAVSLYFKNRMGSKQCRTFVSLFVISILWKLFITTATSL